MERKYNIDLLRIISAVAVIIIHIVSAPITNSSTEIAPTLTNNLNLIHTLMNWSVPVFFMITGFCLQRKSEVTYRYCFSRILKYVCVLFTVGLSYALLEEIFTAKTINVTVFVNSVSNVITGNLWDHMWYIYSLIGIYLVMPVIHLFLKQDKKSVIVLTALLFVFNILLPTFEEFVSFGVSIPFGGYLFYVCFGGIVAQINTDKISPFIYIFGFLSVVWIIIGSKNYEFGYKHLAVCAVAMSIFLITQRINVKPSSLLLCISKCTFGIYLIHPFFINLAIKLLGIDFVSSYAYAKLLAFAAIVSIVSFFTTYILRKIPLIKKLF